MKLSPIIVIVGTTLLTSVALPANKDVLYGPEPAWVIPAPTPTSGDVPTEAAYRIEYSDSQMRLSQMGVEVFQAFKIRILKPEALSLGNLSLSWNPSGGTATVNLLRIVRDGEVTDLVGKEPFTVIQREGALESSVLNGVLTASLQVPGLQVGDEVEFAATTQNKDPTLGDHHFGVSQLGLTGMPGAFRARVIWPQSLHVRWRATSDIANLKPTSVKDSTELLYELRDPHAVVTAQGAPDRVNLRRFIEMSDFESWAELSARFWTLFNSASTLTEHSPIRKEIARIANSSPDPAKRLRLALQLVQNQIRYVYIGLNGANYMPAIADETWERRFGDCKAKTAVLLAILRELGIPAEAVLVDLGGGDGIDQHLPSPLAFNHVLVRATVGDVTYWLDGTRQGDPRLVTEPAEPFRWVLPLRASHGDLVRLDLKPASSPLELTYIFADASKGFNERAPVEMQSVLRGDAAIQLRVGLSVLSAEDARRGLLAYWQKGNPWMEPSEASWHYDEDRGTMILTVKGLGKLDWQGNDSDGRKLDLFGAGFYKPDEMRRPADQDQAAPWKLSFPRFKCWATAVRLPAVDDKWKWDYNSDPIDAHVGGVHYWRTADLRDGIMRTVMSSNTEVPELTALEATQLNKELSTFNYYMSTVYQTQLGAVGPFYDPARAPPFPLDMDWTREDVPCGQPGRQ